MLGILVKKVINSVSFYEKILSFYINEYSRVTLDLYYSKKGEDIKELRKYIRGSWINRKLLKNYSYEVTNENIDFFEKQSNNISSRSAWGILNNDSKSLVFNGYGETLFSCYSKTEFDNLVKLLSQFVDNETIQDFEVLEET